MGDEFKAKAYFDGQAKDYDLASARWPWSMIREWEAKGLMPLLGPVAGKPVLELGSGAGFYTRRLIELDAKHVWAVDISRRMLEMLPKEKVTPLLGDAATINPSRKFDLLFSAGMLEFAPDPKAVFKNAAHLANKGAVLAVHLPGNGLAARCYARFHKGHGVEINLFSKGELERLALDTGWTVEKIKKRFPFSLQAKLART